MIIDWTAQLAPFLWVCIGMLVISVTAIAASVDPDTTELYVSDRMLLVAAAAVVVVVVVVLVAVRYDAAASAAIPLP
jgi:cell division protein FtsW (lipid II flippase)